MSELPPGWAGTDLQTVAEWGSGGTPKAGTAAYYGGEIPWAVIGDLTDGVVSNTQSTITELGLSNSSAKVVGPDHVLIAMYGSIGKLGLPTILLATNQAIAFARPRKEVLARKYLFFYLLSQRSRLSSAGKGATQQNISQAILRSWPLPLPPVAEQLRIVAAIEEQFSRLDAAMEAIQRVRQNLKRMRDSLLSTLARTASEWTTLGEIADIVGGVTKDAQRQTDPTFIEVPYLRVANVQRGYLDLKVVTTIRVPKAQAEKLYLQAGDILFNEGGDRDKLGRGWVWQGEVRACIHQNHVFRARLTSPSFDSKFVSLHGNSFGRTWFEAMGKQTTNLASLNLTTLKNFPVPVLPLAEQKELVAATDKQASLIRALDLAVSQATRRTERLRSATLAAAFSGKLVPQHTSDESAAVVIERIAVERVPSDDHSATRAHHRISTRREVPA
jgi:type I restriction enzyme S subunit